eukprot:CAMPEP_0196667014 /NCGR_PEP_ID=MMETSP1086-20130531/64846_1 /TAXON_ID=77921 /ORGANISM="Cyanoptyche  gloeocystis , Strain SAG4.97" /LENGTH=194 /DNA_ID=CAMNT_0042004293 /DNA_START=126 /DNA_END=710 /DNA_ORIENTATION=-
MKLCGRALGSSAPVIGEPVLASPSRPRGLAPCCSLGKDTHHGLAPLPSHRNRSTPVAAPKEIPALPPRAPARDHGRRDSRLMKLCGRDRDRVVQVHAEGHQHQHQLSESLCSQSPSGPRGLAPCCGLGKDSPLRPIAIDPHRTRLRVARLVDPARRTAITTLAVVMFFAPQHRASRVLQLMTGRPSSPHTPLGS